MKYAPDRSKIAIAVSGDGTTARQQVADRGRGVSGLRRPHLGTRFARGDNVSDVVGSGLGLAIIDDVAAAHGGSFTLTPRDGGGTCATLSLPLRLS
ncbi:MAG: sensor histidine kinase [Paracoccaceae bacterium]